MVDMKVEMVVISEVMVAIKVGLMGRLMGLKEVHEAGVKPVDERVEVVGRVVETEADLEKG